MFGASNLNLEFDSLLGRTVANTPRGDVPWNPCDALLSESINHQLCVYSQYLPIFVHEKRQSSPSGAYCPDVPSLLLRRRYCAECRITFDAGAPRDSRGLILGITRLAPLLFWVSSPPRQIIDIYYNTIYFRRTK